MGFHFLPLQDPRPTNSFIHALREHFVKRISHADMPYQSLFEERPRANLYHTSASTLNSSPLPSPFPSLPFRHLRPLPSQAEDMTELKISLTPFVQSTTPPPTQKSLGFTSSLKLPTALNPTTHFTPNFFNAATLARLLISCGAISWWVPCLARKAIIVGCW